MASDVELLSRLRQAGITLSTEDGQLRVLAPTGALTPALREELFRRKPEILNLLRNANTYSDSYVPPILPVKNEGNLPLSFAQERLWFLNQLEPNAAYNIPLGLRIKGELKVEILQRCLNEVVRRHEILRTRFETVEGQPAQVIEPFTSLEALLVDLSSTPQPQREVEAIGLCRKDAQRLFDLKRDLMLRVKLFRLGMADHILYFNLHHIASDAWSMGVLFSELMTLYKAFVEGKTSPLPDLLIQYADFAVWQRQWLQGETLEKQLSYWRKQLDGAPALLELPSDRPRPATQSYRGAMTREELPNALVGALKELSRVEGTTLFMTLLAAFQTLLHRYTASEDILVGTPIAGRRYTEIEPLVGLFVNTLVMRADLSADPSFRTLLGRTRKMALEAYAHQDLPFEKLVAELRPERIISHSPVFQVLFALQNTPAEAPALPGLEMAPLALDSGASKFDLSLIIRERGGVLQTIVEYSTDLFDAWTVQRMLGHYQRLLEGIVANPGEKISRLPLLTDKERHQILVEWNRTETVYPKDRCIHELVEEQVERTPEAVAVVFEGKRLTYRELNARANQLARHLQKLGVAPDVLVGICMERSPEMVIGLLGILKAGGAYVPLDPEYPNERLAFMLHDTNTRVFLTQKKWAKKLDRVGAQVVCFDIDLDVIACESQENLHPVAKPNNLIYIIYTSGSTGRPKGAGVYHRGFTNLMQWFLTTFVIDAADKILLVSSLSFDLTQKNIYAALTRGGELHLLPPGRYDSDLIARLIQQSQITLLNCTPSAFYPLIQSADPQAYQNLSSLRCVFLGGEPISMQHLHHWLKSEICRAEIENTYGPTECSDISAYYRLNHDNLDRYPFVPTGRPISNVQLVIVSKDLRLCPIGVAGELCVGGIGVGAGYLNDPELTSAKFIPSSFLEISGDKLYRTGDLARYLPDGNIEYLGRLDHQVKIRGFRIELGEIETQLNQHPKLQEAVVVVREDTPGDKRIVAYVTSKNGEAPSASELRELLQTKLPDYMIPAAFVKLDALPLTPNGKVNRKALPKPELELRTDKPDSPDTPTEIVLASIWREVLGLKHVGIHDGFFDLGGHSLLVVRLIDKINRSLKINLSVPIFFLNPTIKKLASLLDRENHDKSEPKLIQFQPGRSAGTLFLINSNDTAACRLVTHLTDVRPAIFATVVPLSYETLRAAARNQTDKLPSVQDLAAPHTALIRSQQLSGPCWLVGYSFGGVLAFEVAHQLQREGRHVEAVFLLDSWAGRRILLPWWKRLKGLTLARAKASLKLRAHYLSSKAWAKISNLQPFVARQSPKVSDSPPDDITQSVIEIPDEPGAELPWEIIRRVYFKAGKDYSFPKLECRGVLFHTLHGERAIYCPDHGWKDLFTRGFQMIEIQGDHHSLLKDPEVLTLAQRIKECMEEFPANFEQSSKIPPSLKREQPMPISR